MRQVDADKDCSKKVANKDACALAKRGIFDCHRFYHCVERVAYKCQNPKPRYSTCSGSYQGYHKHGFLSSLKTRMSTYKCPENKCA